MKSIFRNTYLWLLLLLTIAFVLRINRLGEYLQFLGDQGRDVLVIKRMIVDHDFTLLGPTASVGGFYIGPLYYYFMLPFLWLWNLDPVGPAYLSVLFGVGTVVLIFFFCKSFFGTRVALIAAFLATISPKLIDISRFAWNPNPMPFFSLLAVYFLFLGLRKRTSLFVFMAGLCVGVLQELHYISLVFIPIIYLQTLLIFPRQKLIKNFILLTIGILLGNSLFLLFELRHGFPNSRSAIEFITRGGKTVAPRELNPIALFNDVARQLFEIVFGYRGQYILAIYNLSLVSFLVWVVRNIKNEIERKKIILIGVWLFFGSLGVGFYQGTLLEHYFGYLMTLPVILIALLGGQMSKIKYGLPIFICGLIVFVYFSISRLYIFQEPNNLLEQTKSVSRIVFDESKNLPYNFALITPGNSDHAYRYFLEVWNRPPVTIENPQIDPRRDSVTKQLIVVCEDPKCEPLGNSLWEVAGFGRAEIAGIRKGPAGILIYKLVHYSGK